MGTKQTDVLMAPPSPLAALTLAEMHVRRWELKATCDRCATKLRVSLPAMIWTHGPTPSSGAGSRAAPGWNVRPGS